jgi:hypothetical protein
MNTTPAGPPSEQDGVGAFGWLGHGEEGGAKPVRSDAPPPRATLVDQTEPEHRLDPLAVNTLVNRGLMIVLCIVAVGLTFQTLRSITSSGNSDTKTTNVSPAPPTSTPTATPTTSPAQTPSKVVVTPPTTAATPPVTAKSIPTVAPATVPVSAPPATVPRWTVPASTPIQSVPVQAVAVPVTTPKATVPPDTVAVPYTPTK